MGEARKITGWILGSLCVCLTGVIALWLLRDPAEFVHDRLGVNAQTLRIPWAWALALVVAAGYSFYTLRAVPFVNEHKWDLSPLKVLGAWAAVVSGIVEEIVFRQMLMDRIAGWGAHIVWQILLSAVVFGLAHAVWVLMRGEVRIAVPVIASTTVLGGLLALTYVVAGRNVLPAIVAHTLINLVIEPWLILAAVSGTWEDRASPTDATSHESDSP